ncbi:MAG: anti-sigma factor family protein [Gaiellaceae bacterium]
MTEAAEKLSCQELVELVTDYLEGALSPEERARFEEHVDPCSGCGNYLEQMRRTIELSGRLTPEHLPPGAEDVLLGAFRDWKSPAGQ